MIKLILMVLAIGNSPPTPAPYEWPVVYAHIEACHEVGTFALRKGVAWLKDTDGVPRRHLIFAYRCEEEHRA